MSKIKFNYIKEDLYTPKYVNGALGGVSSKGELIINFFTEMQPVPSSQTQTVIGNELQPEILA